MVKSADIAKEMGINPKNMEFEEYQEILMEFVKKTTGGERLSGLPPHLRMDCISIAAMGPQFKDRMLNQPFEHRNGVWTFPTADLLDFNSYAGIQINLVPKWWQ